MSPLEISPEEFERLARRVTEFNTEYLRSLPELPAFPDGLTGATVAERFERPLPENGVGAATFDDLKDIFAMSRPCSPAFFGYVMGSGEPVAAVADFAASVLNQNLTAWRSAPAAVTIERQVVSWLAEAIGCPSMRGSLCGGGSMANLMGLAMAREAKCPANEKGVQGGVLYTSSQAHMSMPKSAALLGLGHEAVRYIEVDSDFRMKMDELKTAIDADLKAGRKPMAVVASAGTVATGSIDPLNEIADLCQKQGLWMHVDGAYGALAAIATREKFAGLERADSISLDPHKWLYQPIDVSCLLYKDFKNAAVAFSHSGEYVKVLQSDPLESFAFFEETMELTRRFRALKLWMSIRYHGFRAFRERVAEDLRLAQVLAAEIDREPKLERVAPVALSAVCWQVKGFDNNMHGEVLRRVIQRGRVYISNAVIEGRFALRACITNHRTREEDVKAVVSEVLAAAAEVSSGSNSGTSRRAH